MTKLVHSQGGKIFEEFPLLEGVVTIGRSSENDIRVDDITVSGRHAMIEVKPSEYLDGVNDVYISDRQSTNGTMINGKYIKRQLFKHGDIAVIGQHEFALIDEAALGFEQTMVYIPDED